MRVYVRVFATLVEKVKPLFAELYPDFQAGSTLELDMPGESPVTELLDRLRIGPGEATVVFINGRKRDFQHRLADGDHVGIFPPLGGG
jgi:molybdopterin converting factor small subunit